MLLPCDICGGDCAGPRGVNGLNRCPGPPPLSQIARDLARKRIEVILLESDYMLVGVGPRKATLVQLLDRIIDAARKP